MDKFNKFRKLILKLCNKFNKSKKAVALWDFIYVGVLGLNSFIVLAHNNRNESEMMYVICAMAVIYVAISLSLTVILRKDKRRRKLIYLVRKVFRLIYTAVYLTIIMLHLIRLGIFKKISYGQEAVIIYNAVMFIIIAIIGTSSLWWKKVLNIILKVSSK